MFTQEEKKNLKIFLNRVELKGVQEAAALVSIFQKLNAPEKEVDNADNVSK